MLEENIAQGTSDPNHHSFLGKCYLVTNFKKKKKNSNTNKIPRMEAAHISQISELLICSFSSLK